MAGSSYSIANGQKAVHDKALTANQADTVSFVDGVEAIEVISDGTAAIYLSIDSTAATVSGSNCYKIPAGMVTSIVIPVSSDPGLSVSLISSGTPTYSVERAS